MVEWVLPKPYGEEKEWSGSERGSERLSLEDGGELLARQNEQVSALALEELPGQQQVSTRPPIYNYARRSRT